MSRQHRPFETIGMVRPGVPKIIILGSLDEMDREIRERTMAEYTIINRTLADCLKMYWEDDTEYLAANHPKLSTQRAGELVAAWYALLAGRELLALEQECREARVANYATQTHDLLQERNIRQELIEMSKSRTILDDMDKLDLAEQMGIPAPLDYVARWKA